MPETEIDDYGKYRWALARDKLDIQEALINLNLRRGAIQIEGFPDLKVIAHTRSPDYLALHNSHK